MINWIFDRHEPNFAVDDQLNIELQVHCIIVLPGIIIVGAIPLLQ